MNHVSDPICSICGKPISRRAFANIINGDQVCCTPCLRHREYLEHAANETGEPWRKLPCSGRQMDYAKSLGIKFDSGMTRGELHDLISEAVDGGVEPIPIENDVSVEMSSGAGTIKANDYSLKFDTHTLNVNGPDEAMSRLIGERFMTMIKSPAGFGLFAAFATTKDADGREANVNQIIAMLGIPPKGQAPWR